MENKNFETLEEFKAEVDKIVSQNINKSSKQLLKSLDSFSFSNRAYYHLDTERDYLNLYIYSYSIPREQGYVRLYRSAHGLKTQIWEPVEMKYSGISTFPSAHYRQDLKR